MVNEKSERIVIICPYYQFQEYLKSEISKRIANPSFDIVDRADSIFMDALPKINIRRHEENKPKPYFILDFELVLCPFSMMAIQAGDDFCNSIGRYTANPNQRNLDSVVQNSPWYVESDPDGVEIHSSLGSTSAKWPDEHLDVFPTTDYLNWANGCDNNSNFFLHTPNNELVSHFQINNGFMNELIGKGIYDIKTRDLLPHLVNVRPYIPNLEDDLNAIFAERYNDLVLFKKSEPIK